MLRQRRVDGAWNLRAVSHQSVAAAWKILHPDTPVLVAVTSTSADGADDVIGFRWELSGNGGWHAVRYANTHG